MVPITIGTVNELPGCNGDGKTVAELIDDLNKAKALYISDALENGDVIPEPGQLPSGQILLRMPRSLHWRLAGQAELEGSSLNQYIVHLLSSSSAAMK
jgi:antitoxin HicB